MDDKTIIPYFNKETGKVEMKVHDHKTITGERIRMPPDALVAANAAAAKAARRDKAQAWLRRIATRAQVWGPENAQCSAEWSRDRSHLP